MKLTQGTANFWSQIRGYLITSGGTIAFAFLFFGWKIGTVIAFLLIICFFWLIADTKEKIWRTLPDRFQYQPVLLSEYPLLNFQWLHSQTQALEALGFVQLMDYSTGTNPAFGRCLADRRYGCYAEISQVFTATGDTFAKQVVIISYLEKNWTLSSINRTATINDGLSYGFWRYPKAVRVYDPEISLDQLFQKHLELREKIMNFAKIKPLNDVSWDNYVKEQEEGVVYRKRSVKSKFLLWAMWDVTQFELNPKSEWWGDYKDNKVT